MAVERTPAHDEDGHDHDPHRLPPVTPRSKGGVIPAIVGFTSRLRFPWLVAATAALFLFDLLVPDLIPLADEILLGLLTAILASVKRRRNA